MKKYAMLCALTLCMLNCTFLLHAQADFTEGKITYKISVESDNEQIKQALDNSTMIMYVKNSKTCNLMNMGSIVITVIGDKATKQGVMLMDMMGMKKAITMSEDDYKDYQSKAKQDAKDYKVEYSDSTKTIAGYVCKKAIITTKDGSKTILWYTTDINVKSFGGGQYDKIKGFPMQYNTTQQGITLTFTVSDVNKTKVDDTVFATPTGYDQMTMKEFLASMGGGGGDK